MAYLYLFVYVARHCLIFVRIDRGILRSYTEIKKVFESAKKPFAKVRKYDKLQKTEIRRRQIAETLLMASERSSANCMSFLFGSRNETDTEFLNRNLTPYNQHQNQYTGCLALATSSRHWIELHVVLSNSDFVGYKLKDDKTPCFRVPISSIVSVQICHFELCSCTILFRLYRCVLSLSISSW